MNLRKSMIIILILLVPFISSTRAFAGVNATTIYGLGYPVGLAEDSSGNIYIQDDHNSDASKKGIVVVPAATGTLFGQSVTAGTPITLVAVSNPAGVAISPSGTLVWSLSNGDIFALASSSRTVFGVSVSANTVTQIASGTGLRGGLDFDSTGNLFGVSIATGTFAVLPVASGTLYGVSVTANTSATLYSNGSNWFWDLALDSAGNIFVSDGWGLQGVFVMPISSGNIYGQSVTANTFARLSSFGTARYAGIDVDGNDVLFANTYGGVAKAISSIDRTVFQYSLIANTVKSLSSTSGYILQGLLVAANGDIISGGSATYRLVATPDLTVPGAPIIGTATAVNPTSATITFTAPASNGGATIETYTATSTPGSINGRVFQSGSGTITISGLSPSTSYTFVVTASNSVGTSATSGASSTITTPADAQQIEAQRIASERLAVAQREAEKNSARTLLLDLFKKLQKVNLETFVKAQIFGVTDSNTNEFHTEIFALPQTSFQNITEVLKVARKYEVVGMVSSDRVISVYSNSLIEIGLIPEGSKHKAAITSAIRKLPVSDRSTYAALKAAVETELAEIQARKDRLIAVLLRITSNRNG